VSTARPRHAALALIPGLHPAWSLALLLAAALALCFSVHVSAHEAVHHPELLRFPMAGRLITLVLGVPFEGYRWHHANHHRWNNRLEDYSTTWRATGRAVRPWPLWSYVLGWPRQLVRSGLGMRAAAAAGQVPRARQRAIRREQWTLLALMFALGVAAPAVALRYVALVYLGWALVALQNYGQHPPRTYGEDVPASYYAAYYNRLLFRNGLHAEHHDRPQVPWYGLEARALAPSARPHLLAPLAKES
jgi:fatty acid desaturase